MERKDLIPREGTFYKANLHCHSTHSDGRLTPRQLKELYQSNGYRILAYTDHNVLNYFKELNDPGFLVLCGYEADCTIDDCGSGFAKTCHLNAIARDPEKAVYIAPPEIYDIGGVNRMIEQMKAAGYLVNLNHPGWSAQEPEDFLNIRGCTAVEIYNTICELLSNDGDSRLFYSIMLKHGQKLFCIAADDNHNFCRMPGRERWKDDVLGGWTMIRARELTYPEVIRAFEAGEFYCSTGPEIYAYYLENDTLCLDCSPVSQVYLKSTAISVSARIISSKDDITHAEFDLSSASPASKEPFVRIEIKDSLQKTAFTNPLFLK